MNRRKFVKTTGGLTAVGLGITGNVIANDAKGIMAKEVGLKDELSEALRMGEIKKATDIAEKHDIIHIVKSEKVEVSNEEDGEYGTENVRPESSAEIFLSLLGGESDDVWTATGVMKTSGVNRGFRYASNVDDGCGITYADSEWSSIDPHDNNLHLYNNTDKLGNFDIEKEQYETGYGVGVSVEMPSVLDTAGNQTSSVQTDLTRVNSGNDNIPVKFEYSHTRAWSSNLGTVSISIGPAGLSVDTSRADTVWRDSITARPGEYEGPE